MLFPLELGETVSDMDDAREHETRKTWAPGLVLGCSWSGCVFSRPGPRSLEFQTVARQTVARSRLPAASHGLARKRWRRPTGSMPRIRKSRRWQSRTKPSPTMMSQHWPNCLHRATVFNSRDREQPLLHRRTTSMPHLELLTRKMNPTSPAWASHRLAGEHRNKFSKTNKPSNIMQYIYI